MKITDEYLMEELIKKFSYTPFQKVGKWKLKDKEGNLTSVLNLLRAKFLADTISYNRVTVSIFPDSEGRKEAISKEEEALKELIKVLNKKDIISYNSFEIRYLEKLLELKGQYKPFDELLERMLQSVSYGIVSDLIESDEYKSLTGLFCSEELTIENFKRWENETNR